MAMDRPITDFITDTGCFFDIFETYREYVESVEKKEIVEAGPEYEIRILVETLENKQKLWCIPRTRQVDAALYEHEACDEFFYDGDGNLCITTKSPREKLRLEDYGIGATYVELSNEVLGMSEDDDSDGFTDLPEELREIAHEVTSLVLFSTNVLPLPDWIDEFSKLEFLDISGNSRVLSIDEMGCDFTDLSSRLPLMLQTLSLEYLGGLNTLPDSISNLSHLSSLRLSNCPLHELPDSFAEMYSLTDVYFENIDIDVLPDDFGNLSSLATLYIDNCDFLNVLPASMNRLTSLECVYLCNLSALREVQSPCFNGFESLKILQIDDLRCLFFRVEEIMKLANISYLNICNMIDIPIRFENFKHLKSITLSVTRSTMSWDRARLLLSNIYNDFSENMSFMKNLVFFSITPACYGSSRSLPFMCPDESGWNLAKALLHYTPQDLKTVPDAFIPLKTHWNELQLPREAAEWKNGEILLYFKEIKVKALYFFAVCTISHQRSAVRSHPAEINVLIHGLDDLAIQLITELVLSRNIT